MTFDLEAAEQRQRELRAAHHDRENDADGRWNCFADMDDLARVALEELHKRDERIRELEPMEAMTTLASYREQRDRAEAAEARIRELEADLRAAIHELEGEVRSERARAAALEARLDQVTKAAREQAATLSAWARSADQIPREVLLSVSHALAAALDEETSDAD